MLKNVTVDVLVNDKPVTQYHHEGDVFIEGRSGSKYKIRITNKSYKRLKAVVSVDGLSVIDGETASEKSSGYIIAGYGSITIKGWRTSLSSVAAFEFGSKKKSYSNQTGNGTNNVGVIGIMVFEEDAPVLWRDYHLPTIRQYTFDMNDRIVFGSVATASLSNNLGTSMGTETTSYSREVEFKSCVTPTDVHAIYYDDRRGLEARGIVVDERKLKPNPFPAASSQFCKRV